jgi:RNA polymerase sigma factor (TIGR02999 family)
LARLPAGGTLQPTALVHEAWLRLSGEGHAWANTAHFYHAAAQAMRRILIDHFRGKSALKREGGWQRIEIGDFDLAAPQREDHLLLIDESLRRLDDEDPESAEIVMLKFFTGLSHKEAARALGISEATVERRWAFAKVRLFQLVRELTKPPDDGAPPPRKP